MSPLLLFLAACGTPDPDATSGDQVVPVDLTPREMLIRASVDVRGIHPSEEDLAAFEADPSDAHYEQYVDAWLHEDRFLDRMEEVWNGVLRTRTGDTYFDPNDAGLGSLDSRDVADSLGEEPLQLVREIVANDEPWSQIVLADHTMGNAVTAAMWGQTLTGDPNGWSRATYNDGRPMAGVLSSTTLWQRYPSASSNANRHRANNVSRMFLCDDYLSRPVEFSRSDVEAATTEELEDVIRTNPTCVGCHSSLDPLAAHFFGFWWEKDETLAARTRYYAEDENDWQSYAGRAPNYYGQPTSGLRDLAQHLADDPRFTDCAVRTMWQGIQQREATDDDWGDLADFESDFAAGGYTMRALVKSIVTSDTYKHPVDSATISSVKMVSPQQLRDIVAEKTGYEWTFDGRPGLSVNDLGLPVLMGGTDGRYVVDRNTQPTVSAMFVQERLSQAAGYRVAASDLAGETVSAPVLLKYVGVMDTPDANRQGFEDQVRFLYLHLTGIPLAADAPEVDECIDLWKQIFSVTSSPTSAWSGVIAAVLRDPRLLFY
jgi:hypothetical protein